MKIFPAKITERAGDTTGDNSAASTPPQQPAPSEIPPGAPPETRPSAPEEIPQPDPPPQPAAPPPQATESVRSVTLYIHFARRRRNWVIRRHVRHCNIVPHPQDQRAP